MQVPTLDSPGAVGGDSAADETLACGDHTAEAVAETAAQRGEIDSFEAEAKEEPYYKTDTEAEAAEEPYYRLILKLRRRRNPMIRLILILLLLLRWCLVRESSSLSSPDSQIGVAY